MSITTRTAAIIVTDGVTRVGRTARAPTATQLRTRVRRIVTALSPTAIMPHDWWHHGEHYINRPDRRAEEGC